MENFEIIISDKTIYDNITKKYGDLFLSRVTDYLSFIAEWISRNSAALGSKNIGKRLPFYNTDEQRIYNIFEVDPSFIKKVIKSSKYIQKNWRISNEPLNVLMYILIFFYYDNRNKFEKLDLKIEPYRLANIFLCARFFSTLTIRQFKYEPDDAIMFYTLENLSNKYTITKMNSLYEMIQYLADSNIDTQIEEKKIEIRTDKELDGYMRKLNTRISSMLVNISQVFYENHKLDKKTITESNTIEYEDGNKDLAVTTSISTDLDIVTRKVINNFIVNGTIDIKMLRIACNKTDTNYNSMYKVLQEIYKDRDPEMENLIRNILSYFLVSAKGKVSEIHSFKFFEITIKAYRVSNSNDTFIEKIKINLNSLLEKHSELYIKSNRKNTKSNMRSCLYLYTILIITRLS